MRDCVRRVSAHFGVGIRCCICLAGALSLGGCWDPTTHELSDGVPPVTSETIQSDASVQYYPSDEPLRLATEHFKRGSFGLAARYFRDAVEKTPKDASAWIGLAASYDHLGRFDLADQAYVAAVRLAGETPALLNNRGYSYMLRSNLVAARRDLVKAYQLDPKNPIILNNLKLLGGSARFVERSPDVQ